MMMARHDQARPFVEETVQLPSLGRVEQAGVVEAAHAAGAMAVQYAGLAASHAGTPLEASFRDQALRHEADLNRATDSLRDSFRRVSGAQVTVLDNYLAGLATKVYPGAHHRHDKPAEQSWADWLGTAAPAGEVLDFMAAHRTALLEQVQDPEVHAVIERERAGYIDGIRTMVAGDRMSLHALQAIAKLKSTRILIGDVWDTTLQGVGGYHIEGGPNEVVIAQHIEGRRGYPDRLQVLEHVLPHELGHVEFGHGLPAWLNESTNELLRLSIQNGEYERVASYDSSNPESRSDVSLYPAESSLLATLLHKGGQRLATALATKAFTSEGLGSVEYRQLGQALDESWGIQDVIGTVTAKMGQATARLQIVKPELNFIQIQSLAAKEVDAEFKHSAAVMRQGNGRS